MSRSHRDIGGSFTLLVPERSIGSCAQKRFDDICSPFLGRDHQRAISKVVPLVRSGALLQQAADDVIHARFRRHGPQCLPVVSAAVVRRLNSEAGTIYVFDDTAQEFHLRATYGMDEAIIAEIKDRHIHIGETAIGQAVEQRIPIQIPDIRDDPNSAVLDIIVRAATTSLRSAGASNE
jgi:hypothetical protein